MSILYIIRTPECKKSYLFGTLPEGSEKIALLPFEVKQAFEESVFSVLQTPVNNPEGEELLEMQENWFKEAKRFQNGEAYEQYLQSELDNFKKNFKNSGLQYSTAIEIEFLETITHITPITNACRLLAPFEWSSEKTCLYKELFSHANSLNMQTLFLETNSDYIKAVNGYEFSFSEHLEFYNFIKNHLKNQGKELLTRREREELYLNQDIQALRTEYDCILGENSPLVIKKYFQNYLENKKLTESIKNYLNIGAAFITVNATQLPGIIDLLSKENYMIEPVEISERLFSICDFEFSEKHLTSWGKIKHAYIYNQLGKLNIAQGEYELSIAHNTRAIEMDPTYLKAYLDRAYVFICQKKFDEAIIDLIHTLTIKPDDFCLHLNLGYVFDAQEKYDEAISEYSYVLEHDPKIVDAYQNRGNSYLHKNELDLAIEDYNAALNLDPNKVECYLPRAYIYCRRGQFDLAMIDYAMVLEIEPQHDAAIEGLEIILTAITEETELNGLSREVICNIIKKLPESMQKSFKEKFLDESSYCINGTQKNIIKGMLVYNFDAIALLGPKIAIKALSAMLLPTLSEEDIQLFEEKEVMDSIDMVREILAHTCPQNRTTNNSSFGEPEDSNIIVYKNEHGRPAFEQKGLLSLSARNDGKIALNVTKVAVVKYICQLIREQITEQQKLIFSQSPITTLLILRAREGTIFSKLPEKILSDMVELHNRDYNEDITSFHRC